MHLSGAKSAKRLIGTLKFLKNKLSIGRCIVLGEVLWRYWGVFSLVMFDEILVWDYLLREIIHLA